MNRLPESKNTIQFNHSSFIDNLRFTSDGKTLISACNSKIKFRDMETKQVFHTIEGRFSWLFDIAVTPDGKTLISASDSLDFWDIQTGELTDSIKDNFAYATNIAITQDGQFFAFTVQEEVNPDSHDYLYRIEVWRMKNKEKIWAIKGAHNATLAFSPDGNILCCGFENGTIKFFDFATSRILKTHQNHLDSGIFDIHFSPDGKKLIYDISLTGTLKRKLYFLDVQTGKILMEFDNDNKRIFSLALSPDKEILAAGSEKEIVFLELKTMKVLQRLKSQLVYERKIGKVAREFAGILSVAFSPDGAILAAGGNGLEFWDLKAGQLSKKIDLHEEDEFVSFSPDGRTLVSSSRKRITFLDVNTQKADKVLFDDSAWIKAQTFSPCGKFLAYAGDDKVVTIVDVENKQIVQKLDCPTAVNAIQFNHDGSKLVVGCFKEVMVWNVQNWKYMESFKGDWLVYAIAFNERNELMICAKGPDYVMNLWNVTKSKLIQKLNKRSLSIYSVQFALDGSLLATGDEKGKINLWDTITGELIRSFEGERPVMCLSFNGRAELLASGDFSGKISLWDVKSGNLVHNFEEHTAEVHSLAFSPDGKLLVSASSDGTVRLWDIKKKIYFANMK